MDEHSGETEEEEEVIGAGITETDTGMKLTKRHWKLIPDKVKRNDRSDQLFLARMMLENFVEEELYKL